MHLKMKCFTNRMNDTAMIIGGPREDLNVSRRREQLAPMARELHSVADQAWRRMFASDSFLPHIPGTARLHPTTWADLYQVLHRLAAHGEK